MSGPGLCVFDIDNTLMRGPEATEATCPGQGPLPMKPVCHNCNLGPDDNGKPHMYPSAFAAGAIKECLARGYNVGVATAEACAGPATDPFCVTSRLKLLEGLGMPKDVVYKGVPGPALQCRDATVHQYGHKAVMVKNLISHYHSDPKKVVFFDDDSTFRAQVRDGVPGTIVGKASRSCGGDFCATGCGLSKHDFFSAMDKIDGKKRK